MPVAELGREALAAWGREFGASLSAPALVALDGDLGAGKTTLVQAISAGLGISDEVTSPTYALVHEYASARGTVHHLDLYRLRDPAQLAQLGWDDILRARGIVLVEWPGHGGAAVPTPTHAIRLAHVPGRPEVRRIEW